MSYKEQVIQTYVDSMKAYGMSELNIKIAKMAFETGYAAGVLEGNSEDRQDRMVKCLMYDNKVN
ncbi:hypothetical protein [Metabacillus arenae]|uniref:Uncharacterized protein n=1 Tax=Metabacillus arenae TaxID=2771434 RepID=A0A926RVP4_9BACI|nr:hypothetical protein [Metabacillus arenae]MBD1379096.1 hypothetical protein [Metabacillus arenae]